MMRWLLTMLLAVVVCISASAQKGRPIKILFLGDDAGHRPIERFRALQPVLAKRGIDLVYTDKVASLDPKILGGYDGLAIYANHLKIEPEQEKALLEFVASGKGFVPIHCASYCFLNSPKYVELVGGQFQRHGTGVVATKQTNLEHPILKGFGGFRSWDETYVHARHNDKDRTILETRDEAGTPEPWTWVRTHGKGRVFYTAWGHDLRTWSNPGFHNLIERGIRWAVGGDPGVVPAFKESAQGGRKPFEYQDAKVPFYPAGKGWGTTAGPIATMQRPVEPEESIRHMVVPEEMRVELFASEPAIRRPICMNWDARGRLWIAESLDYPNERKPPGQGRDRIVICEDTDGDGKADKVTVFADKLSVPTGFTFARGGVIVLQAPETLFLKDTDGDDRADVREVLFAGWGTFDTHAGPSNLQYGFDNWIYGIVGYSGFDGEVGGERHKFANGFFRFRPDGSKLEFLRNTSNNSWGVGFTEDGLLFGSTANGDPSVHLAIPNRYYEKVRGWSSGVLRSIADSAKIAPITDKIRQVDHHGHFTAAAGHAIYTARTYPKEYWNRAAFVTEPTGHLVARFDLEPKGGSFISRNRGSFLASDDEWTAPIAAEVGPDGQVWIIDWYNYIVQHNPTPPGFKTGAGNAYETPLRDKTHGRIVRVIHSQGMPSRQPTLDVDRPEMLIAALTSDNLFWRRHAQRLLVERGKTDVVPELIKLVRDPSVDEIGLNVGAIHALWTLHGLNAMRKIDDPASQAALAALEHKSPAVRRAAVMTLPRDLDTLAALLARRADPKGESRLGALFRDADPRVKLAALLALAEMPPKDGPATDTGKHAFGLLCDESLAADPVTSDAATCALTAQRAALFSIMTDFAWPADPKWKLANRPLLERVVGHEARGGSSAECASLIRLLKAMPADVRGAILTGLVQGWPANSPPKLDADAVDVLRRLLASSDVKESRDVVLLANRWKLTELRPQIASLASGYLKQLHAESETEANRLAAAATLVELRGRDADLFKDVADALSPRSSPALAVGVIDALGRSEISTLGNDLAALAPTLTPAVRPAIVRVLLARPEWTRSLLDALDKGTIGADALTLDQKQRLLAHPTASLAARAKATFAKSGGLPNPDREKVLAELMPLTKDEGDPKQGKTVFAQHCAKCHRHGGEGASIGPDLTGMAVHPKAHLLTEIIDPNRSVEGNFRQYVVATRAGRLLTGLLASESKTAIELVDAEAKTHALQRDDIEELRATSKSLMPEGFEKQISPKDLVNLLAFLTQRGRYLPLPLARAATTVSTKGMFTSESEGAERLILPHWGPVEVSGVPFQLVDPLGDRVANVVVLAGPKGSLCADNPRSVSLACNAPATAIHILGGVGGWAFPLGTKGSVSLIVRLRYADGTTEDHPLRNGEHFADYIRRVDVPASKFAFSLRGQQMRYVAIAPARADVIERIELVKGDDGVAPIVMAVTVETR